MTLQPQRQRQEIESRDALRVPQQIEITQLQTTATLVFTARADADFQIEGLVATNVTDAIEFITVFLVPDGGTAETANTIVFEKRIPAKSGVTIFDINNQALLTSGGEIQALCKVNDAVNLWGFGFDYQGVYS